MLQKLFYALLLVFVYEPVMVVSVYKSTGRSDINQ